MQPSDYSGQGGLDSDIDLYDHDVLNIQRVVTALSSNIGQRRNLESFRQQAIEMFGQIGFHVEVDLYEAEDANDPGSKFIHPAITIKSRLEPEEEFDHGRQGHEVRANIRGLKNVPDKAPAPVSMAGTNGSAFHRAKSGLFLPK